MFTLTETRSLAQSGDQAAVRVLVRQYFEAWRNEDLNEVMRLWSEKSPDVAAAKTRLQNFFAANDKIELKNLQVRRIVIDGERASALATVEGSAIDAKSGKPSTSVSKMNRTLSFAKEAGAWKVWRDAVAEADLAAALVAARSDEERAALLEKEKEFLTAELLRALNTLGDKPRTQGKYADALRIYSIAEKVAEQMNDRSGIARAFLLTGIVHYRLGQYDLSLDYLQKSLKLRESLNQKAEVAEALRHIGIVHYLRSDYEIALEYYKKSLSLSESIGLGDKAGDALTGIGIVHFRQANYDLALDYYRRALAAREKAGNRLAIGYALSNVGGLYQVLGNYGLALDYHQKALSAFEDEGAKPDAVTTLSNIGLLYRWQGNYELALEYYQKGVLLAEAQGQEQELGTLWGHIGDIQTVQGQYARALENVQKSLSTAERLGNKQRAADDLFSIGTIHESQGDYVRALEYHQKSLSLSRAINTKDRVADSLSAIGRIYNLQGKYAAALESAEAAVNIARQVGRPETLRHALIVAGTAQVGLKHPDKARRAFEEAIATVEGERSQVVGGEDAQRRSFEGMVYPYQKMVELLVSEGKADEALTYAEHGKARVLLDVLRSGRVNVTKAMSAREHEQERSLRSALVVLNTQISGEERRSQPDQARLSQLKDQLEKARLDYEDFQTRLYATHPELRIKRGEALLFKSDQAAKLLTDSRTALLEYVVTDDAAYLFVLTAGRDAQKPDLKVYDLKIKRVRDSRGLDQVLSSGRT